MHDLGGWLERESRSGAEGKAGWSVLVSFTLPSSMNTRQPPTSSFKVGKNLSTIWYSLMGKEMR